MVIPHFAGDCDRQLAVKHGLEKSAFVAQHDVQVAVGIRHPVIGICREWFPRLLFLTEKLEKFPDAVLEGSFGLIEIPVSEKGISDPIHFPSGSVEMFDFSESAFKNGYFNS